MASDHLEQQLQWAVTFATVVAQGSFTRAAEALGCTKAAVSKRITQLEAALGTQLLYRTTRRLALTEAGRVYLTHCGDWPERVAAAQRAVAEVGGKVAGTVRLSVPTSFGGVFMARALLAFREHCPEVAVELDLSAIPRDLEAEGYDLAIRLNLAPPERLVSRPLAVLRDWVVASPAAVATHGLPAQPAALADWPCLTNHHFREPEHWAFERDGTLLAVNVTGPWRANDYSLLRNLALGGAGAARVPSYLVAADVAEGRLLRLLPAFDLPAQPMYFVYPRRLPQPAKVRVLIDFLADWFAQPAQAALLGLRSVGDKG
ncbi:LysR family transcriptional regulator [Chitiniphilus eburneus]|nr:LysR family transcriptional regulator [Chitiniphilus eburneus]